MRAAEKWMSLRFASRTPAALIALALAACTLAGLIPVRAEARTPVPLPACGSPGTAGVLASMLPLGTLATPAPAITAKAAVVLDGETGRVLYDDRARHRLPPASVTKIMTAILAIERGGDLRQTVISSVDASAMTGSSVMGLRPGVAITMQDLLYGLMLPSGNDAAVQIARTVAGSEAAFVHE